MLYPNKKARRAVVQLFLPLVDKIMPISRTRGVLAINVTEAYSAVAGDTVTNPSTPSTSW